MAQYLSEIGAENAYIDKEVMRARGITNDPWVHITRGVIGRETMQSEFFKANLKALKDLEENQKLEKIRMKKERKR